MARGAEALTLPGSWAEWTTTYGYIDNVAAAQQAELEMERLELKIRLISNRLNRLEVRSPLDGIVLVGDLKKTEGAPLTVGQAMFEIAPLDRMIVEVEIPEREILHVEEGREVAVLARAFGLWWLNACRIVSSIT